MAQYLHLPLYRTTYTLLLEIMQTAKDFPREFKYSLGEKLQNSAVEMLTEIYKANNAKEKSVHIKQILELAQLVGLFIRIAYDLKIMSEARYLHFVEKLASASKQAQGWLQSCAKNNTRSE